MSGVRVKHGLVALLVLGNAFLLTECVTYSRNTLGHHPQWVLGKLLTQEPVMGGELALTTRNLLAQNRLHLDAWHGYQEVLYHRPLPLSRLRLRYRLDPQAWLLVEVNRTREGFSALRLGPHPAWVRVDAAGEFLEEKPFPLQAEPGWHELEIDAASTRVDGLRVADGFTPGSGLVGLRGGVAPVTIDDVELWEGGRRVVAENFRNSAHFGGVLLADLALLSLLAFLVCHRREGVLWAILLNLVVGGALLAWLGFDYAFWSAKYHQRNNNLFDADSDFPEHWRLNISEAFRFADPLPAPEDDRVRQFLGVAPAGHPPYRLQVGAERLADTGEAVEAWRRAHPGPLLLLLGTSQTYGEGAARREEGLVPHLGMGQIWVVNAGMRGSESPELVKRYEDHLRLFGPDLVVVNLGTNDRDPALLRASLERLAAQPVPLLFVLEANSPEKPNELLAGNHQVMREVAQKHGIPVLDAHALLKSHGLAWWDFVHPTSYGHRLLGELLGEGIRQRWGRVPHGSTPAQLPAR